MRRRRRRRRVRTPNAQAKRTGRRFREEAILTGERPRPAAWPTEGASGSPGYPGAANLSGKADSGGLSFTRPRG